MLSEIKKQINKIEKKKHLKKYTNLKYHKCKIKSKIRFQEYIKNILKKE